MLTERLIARLLPPASRGARWGMRRCAPRPPRPRPRSLGHHVLVHAQRIVRQHVLVHPGERVLRRHAPVRRARAHDLDERVAAAVDLRLERSSDGLLRLAHVLRAVDGDALEVRHAVQRAQKLAHADGEAGRLGVAAVGGRLGHLVRQARGGHLAARHAVDGVVHEDDGDVLAARGRVDRLGHADGRQVAVRLVGEHHAVGQRALHRGGHRRGAAVRASIMSQP